MAEEKPLVLITGISGFLGAHTCLAFLSDGSYRVRGTVRSKTNEAKLEPLQKGFGELFDQLELVEADLTDEASLVNACAGATYVVHTASPFNFKGDCVGPAVAGTNAIMKACTTHGVKKLVITSSCVAIQCPAKADAPPQGTPYTEANWSNPDRPEGLGDYFKSKTLAELAAWEYQAKNPGFDVSTINPVFIIGPSFFSGGDGTSESYVKAIVDGTNKEIPRGGMGMVDVRDVALAHVKCLQVPEAANKRFILSNYRVMYKDIYEWLAANFNEKGGKVATTMKEGEDPTTFDLLDNTRSKEILGIVYTDMAKTFIDAADSLIAAGQGAQGTKRSATEMEGSAEGAADDEEDEELQRKMKAEEEEIARMEAEWQEQESKRRKLKKAAEKEAERARRRHDPPLFRDVDGDEAHEFWVEEKGKLVKSDVDLTEVLKRF